MNFDLAPETREKVWMQMVEILENYYAETEKLKTSLAWNRDEVKTNLVTNFDQSLETEEAVKHVVKNLTKYGVHTPHPDYFGLFNPRTNFPSIVADVITATFNPQMAAWSHAPFASEVENLLIREIGKKFGYQEPDIDGVFATGGAEANLTAVLCAINSKFPKFASEGVFGIERKPKIYCTAEAHYTALKAARICGLGSEAMSYIAINESREMIADDLEMKIEEDLDEGNLPLLIFATMGTTGTGSIDPISQLSRISKKYDCWLHADAAYGGAVVLTNEYKHLLSGIEEADSITFDAHKWLSIPMAAGMFFTRHRQILGQTFRISTDYMPNDETDIKKLGSYTHSIQWSRRFIGLKLYLPLLVFGWKGYEETILHQIEMGKKLNEKLIENDWTVYNETDLPIACFSDERFSEDSNFAEFIAEKIVKSGRAWISTYPIGNKMTIRACITNYAKNIKNLDKLIASLNEERENYIDRN